MKNVLLATTAIALTAGYAAADVSYSASAKLSYGNFGEQNTAGTTYGYSDTFDFGVSGSGEAGGVAYSASMTIDEDAASNALGAFSGKVCCQSDSKSLLTNQMIDNNISDSAKEPN